MLCIRIVPGSELTLAELEAELGVPCDPVPWLPSSMGFLSIPGHVSINSCSAYARGAIVGMDASSGAAVAALNPVPGDDVLDLCCAPGMKFCLIADVMERQGTLTGVDASRVRTSPTYLCCLGLTVHLLKDRLAPCCTLLKKYSVVTPGVAAPGWRCRLFATSGLDFDTPPPDAAATQPIVCHTCSKPLGTIRA